MPRTEGILRNSHGPGPEIAILTSSLLAIGLGLPGVSAAEPPGQEALSGWRYLQELPLPAQQPPSPPPRGQTARLYDFVLPAAVFDGARADLGDLRLYDP